jgi:hypothetical protein
MISERTSLLTAKRETEDELVRTIIKLSSAALLLIPGILVTSGISLPRGWSIILLSGGAAFFVASLIAAMLEQFLSSRAYEKQVAVSQAYFQQLSVITHDEESARQVRLAQLTAFGLFIAGVVASAFGLALAAIGLSMAQQPRPQPRPEPVHIPDHKTDQPGRSVPPPAPPPPPPKKD